MSRKVKSLPKRHLQQTVTARVSDSEHALIRRVAEIRSREEGRRVTPSSLVRRAVLLSLKGQAAS